MVVIDMNPRAALLDPGYESRCIRHDAERAAKMGDKIEKACSWEKGTIQYATWYRAFIDAGGKE